MWSFHQYRQIGKEVQQDWQKKRLPHRRDVEEFNLCNSEESNIRLGLQQTQSPNSCASLGGRPSNAQHLSDKEDHILVEVASDNDPFDPRNWSLLSRAKNVAILSLLIFIQAWAGASDSQTNSPASKFYHVSQVAENLATAMYLFGIGSGCLFVGPLSESIGRNPTYLISTFCYLFFVLGSALSESFASHIVCRYFIGVSSSATLGINGASVKDMFRPVKRAFVFPVIAWANVVPPVLAPIVSGWVASRIDIDFRWTEWITLIISGFIFIIAFLFLPETYVPILLDWKAKHLCRITGSEAYVSAHAKNASFTARMKQTLPLSLIFLFTEPVIMVLGSFLVLLYILLFSFLSGFDYIFKRTYALSPLQSGGCFAGIAIGATVFTLFAPILYTWARRHTEHISGAHITPEFRLWPALVTAPLLPISLFWLGWTNYPSISIYSGLGACFCFGIVLAAMYVSAYEYIIDSYGEHAAIALASITMVRYLIAGGMVLVARPMYERIGVHWAMTLLGCVATILTPGPWLLFKWGRRLRERSPYAKVHGKGEGQKNANGGIWLQG